jgi:hypothetical protein
LLGTVTAWVVACGARGELAIDREGAPGLVPDASIPSDTASDAERDDAPDVVASGAVPGGVGGGSGPPGIGAAGGEAGSGSIQPPPPPIRPPPPPTAPVVPPPAPTMMPGTAEDPKISDRCTVIRSQATENECSIELTCAESYIIGRCEMAGGEANCSCDNKRGYAELRLSGVSAMRACEVVAAECDSPTIDPAAPPSCALRHESTGKGSCDADRECSHVVQTVSGVMISTVTSNGVHCNDQVGTWSCGCFGTPADRSFVFETSAQPRDACRQALEICEEAALTPVGTASCEINETVASQNDCRIVHACRVEGTTQSGTDIYSVAFRQALCFAGAPGVEPEPGLPPEESAWSCECRNASGRKSLQPVVSASDSVSACQAAATVCGHF